MYYITLRIPARHPTQTHEPLPKAINATNKAKQLLQNRRRANHTHFSCAFMQPYHPFKAFGICAQLLQRLVVMLFGLATRVGLWFGLPCINHNLFASAKNGLATLAGARHLLKNTANRFKLHRYGTYCGCQTERVFFCTEYGVISTRNYVC